MQGYAVGGEGDSADTRNNHEFERVAVEDGAPVVTMTSRCSGEELLTTR
jgi:hypothetical protein